MVTLSPKAPTVSILAALRSPAFSRLPIADGLSLALVAASLDADRAIVLPRSGLVGTRVGRRIIFRKAA